MNQYYFSEERRNSNTPSEELLNLALTLRDPNKMRKLDPVEAYRMLNAIVRGNKASDYILAIGTSATFEEAVKLTATVAGYKPSPTSETRQAFEDFVYLLLMFYASKLEAIKKDVETQREHIAFILPERFINRP